MKKSVLTALMVAAAIGLAASPTLAAPLEQLSCPYDMLKPAEREVLGAMVLAPTDQKPQAEVAAAIEMAEKSLDAHMQQCIDKHRWSQNDADNAYDHSVTRTMAESLKNAMVKMGADPAAADLFYAQNKYKIIEESEAGRPVEEWTNTRLAELGFAKKGSEAMFAAAPYLGLLFHLDDAREAFVTGKKAEWTQEPQP